MEYQPFWCNIDHKLKNIDHLSKMVDYRQMVDNIDPVAGLCLAQWGYFNEQSSLQLKSGGFNCMLRLFLAHRCCSTSPVDISSFTQMKTFPPG